MWTACSAETTLNHPSSPSTSGSTNLTGTTGMLYHHSFIRLMNFLVLSRRNSSSFVNVSRNQQSNTNFHGITRRARAVMTWTARSWSVACKKNPSCNQTKASIHSGWNTTIKSPFQANAREVIQSVHQNAIRFRPLHHPMIQKATQKGQSHLLEASNILLHSQFGDTRPSLT